MRGPKLTKAQLQEHLDEQIAFLKHSARDYDVGTSFEAKRLAATIRTMVYDGGSSKSLLGQLDLKSLLFVDSCMGPLGNAAHSGLTAVLVSAVRGGSKPKFVAHLDDPPQPVRHVSFSDWWEGAVLWYGPQEGHKLSRKDVVMAMANQDGGAHVDEGLVDYYDALKNQNIMGTSSASDGQPLRGVELAIVRQVAHELLKTLDSGYECRRQDPEPAGLVFAVGAQFEGDPSP